MRSNIEGVSNANQSIRADSNHTKEGTSTHPICQTYDMYSDVKVEPSEVVVEGQKWIVNQYVGDQKSQETYVTNG